MKKIKIALLGLVSFSSVVSQAVVSRPPQLIALAFDNCSENTRWSELKDFTQEMQEADKPVHFTYFVSGVNFITNANRKSYTGPGKAAGKADIDFSEDESEISERLGLMHDVYEMGGELASHTVGHFHGGEWGADSWLKELRTFEKLFQFAFSSHGYDDADEMTEKIKGFRAPYLETSPGLYTALEQLKYRYDTSTDAESTDWPQKKGKLWLFPLANLKIADSGKRTLSMDYNFFATQSGAEDNAAKASVFQQQMLDTYLAYFKSNYTGNRAPLNIGHHFFGYQGGAYNRALKQFARLVCGLPEVKCVNYTELTDYMDSLDSDTIKAFQRGNFPKASSPL